MIEFFEKNEITISKCIPKLVSGTNKLSKLIKPGYKYASKLIKDISKRLETVLNPYSNNFNIVYALATYLDNTTHKLLYSTSLLMFKELAEQFIASKICIQTKIEKADFGDFNLGDDTISDDQNAEFKM